MELTKNKALMFVIAIFVVYLIFVAVSLYWSYESHKKLMQIYEEALQWDKAKEHT